METIENVDISLYFNDSMERMFFISQVILYQCKHTIPQSAISKYISFWIKCLLHVFWHIYSFSQFLVQIVITVRDH